MTCPRCDREATDISGDLVSNGDDLGPLCDDCRQEIEEAEQEKRIRALEDAEDAAVDRAIDDAKERKWEGR